MSSTERAPEPTMEEILASIRRIISDDEASSGGPRAAPSRPSHAESLESAEEGEADDKIIDDIARVLSGGEPAAVEDEEILDLTSELGGLEVVEGQQLEAATPESAVSVETLELVSAEPWSESEAESEAPLGLEEPGPAPAMAVAEPPQPISASEEAASALERAIAALRAGQASPSLDTPLQSEPEPQAEPAPPIFAFEPAAEPSFEAAAIPSAEPAWQPESEPSEPELEPELVLTEVSVAVSEEMDASEPVAAEPKPFWPIEPAPWSGATKPLVEPERTRSNGSGTHAAYGEEAAASEFRTESSPKTFEDSVKDMLRPMLRQWLEENMERVLTTALKDEIKDDALRRHQD